MNCSIVVALHFTHPHMASIYTFNVIYTVYNIHIYFGMFSRQFLIKKILKFCFYLVKTLHFTDDFPGLFSPSFSFQMQTYAAMFPYLSNNFCEHNVNTSERNDDHACKNKNLRHNME